MHTIIQKIETDSFLINNENLRLMELDLINLGISKESLFYELYTTYYSFAVGNGTELFSLEQIENYNNSNLEYIIFGCDDGGTLVYNKRNDKVLEYASVCSSNEELELNKYEKEWESFESFLIDYYSEYL